MHRTPARRPGLSPARGPVRLLPWAAAVVAAVLAGAAAAAPVNDNCTGTVPALTVNVPELGTLTGATNDYQLVLASACFHGTDQTKNTAGGPDVVYSFTAPAPGAYSFRVQMTGATWDTVLYVADVCPVVPPTPQTIAGANCIDAANRNGYTSAYRTTEENPCIPLGAGQQVFVFVDQTSSILQGPFVLEVTACNFESESNDTPALADPFVCGIEGSVDTLGDFDYFSLSAPPAGSRVFAVADATPGRTDNIEMRVTTQQNTLEYDDKDNDIPFGDNSPNIEGRPLTGDPAYLQISINPASTPPSRPYRVYAAVQPPGPGLGGSSATPEVEPNNTTAQANSAGNLYFSGSLPLTSDKDYYRFCASKGDLVFLGLDADPLKNPSTRIDGELFLYDQAGTQLLVVDDANRTTNATPGTGNLFSTTPSSPGEAIWWRARYTGVYYAAVDVSVAHGQALFGDYLLSISENCRTGSQMAADLSVTKTGSPDPVEPGSNVTYTITVTNNGPDVATEAVLTDTLPIGAPVVSFTPAPGWTCTTPAGTIVCGTPCLAAGEPQVFTLVVATAPCSTGAVANRVLVSARTADPNNANNGATASVTISCDDGDPCTVDACNPSGGCVHRPRRPGEVANLLLGPAKTTLRWDPIVSPLPGTLYDVPRGLVDELPVGSGASEICLIPGGTSASTASDPSSPDPNRCYWYLVRARDVCGSGTYGFSAVRGVPALERITGVCP